MRERTLFIFRHGETDWNKAGRFQGNTDIPLNDTGRAQAEALRRFFTLNPVDAFMSSDLSRALETAKIASGELKVPIIVDRRLRETSLGKAEGLTREEIVNQLGPETLEQWAEVYPPNPHFRFPNGETKAEHLARLLEGIADVLQRNHFERWGIASHGGAMRRLIHHLAPNLEMPVTVANGVVYEMRFDLDRGLSLIDLEPKKIP